MSHPPIQMDNHHHHHHRQYPPVTPSASGFARQNKPSIAEDDDIMELLWQNGKVVMQSQNHRSLRKPPLTEIPPLLDNFNNHLFMPFDHTFPLDFLYSPPSAPATPRPPIPPSQPNFASFSSHNTRAADLSVMTAARDSTVVDSCHTPAEGFVGAPAPSTTGAGGRTTMMCDLTMTSSPEASSNSDEPVHVAPPDDRKRKGREAHEWECQSEDVDFELEAKKQVGGSTSTKRSRAAEVHNLSERRRRDRINEKMRALQELIPRCNKSDKASMLDEAISYLKSLQLQVQMMSMGCGMMPMMFPGIQQYMPAIGMGVGIGMGMEMGMNRPLMPFPNMLSGSALPAATAAAHLGPRFPMPPFHVPNVPVPHDSSRLQPPNQTDDNMVTSAGPPDPNQSRIPNFTDPYQQYLGSHQMQFQLIPNQAMNQPNVSKPSTSRGLENPENHESGERKILW